MRTLNSAFARTGSSGFEFRNEHVLVSEQFVLHAPWYIMTFGGRDPGSAIGLRPASSGLLAERSPAESAELQKALPGRRVVGVLYQGSAPLRSARQRAGRSDFVLIAVVAACLTRCWYNVIPETLTRAPPTSVAARIPSENQTWRKIIHVSVWLGKSQPRAGSSKCH
jgi:hypothetical protein